jgi:membrane-bound lytic murein transglycosylase D
VPSPPGPFNAGPIPAAEEVSVVDPPPEPEEDALLGSPAARDTAFARQVDEWTVRWTSDYAEWFTLYLERMGAYGGMVDEVLEAEGLPPSLRYLPIVESGYSPRAVSGAAAAGMWQFMAGTARSMGMRVDGLVDERRDPVASTLAAARFLKQLNERFGSWFLALAAYNGGPNRIDRLLRLHAPLERPSDEHYMRIQKDLPTETAEFVSKFFAAARVARAPDRYGVAPEALQEPVVWDEVTIEDAASLDVVAEAAGVTEDEVRALNPHIVRRVTPKGAATVVRLPVGTGEGFASAFARIPADRRVTISQHVVARGETLWEIARFYGIGLDDLQGANPNVDPRRMRPGEELLVPRLPGQMAASQRLAANGGGGVGGSIHVVESGDTLWDLARRYDVGVNDLLRWNELSDGAVLIPGQELKLGG